MTRRVWLLVCACLWTQLISGANHVFAGKIEADPRKEYTVTKQHGPWMIMVTSLRGDTAESVTAANKAARELVLELRQRGIPAYVYSQKGELEEVSSFDREGHSVKRFVAEKRNRICVLAGNYHYGKTEDEKLAQDTLAWIQNFKPKSLEKGSYKPTPGRPGPLSRAFLTFNPLLSDDEIKLMAVKHDPLLKSLNSDREYNLLANKGKFTVVVATFSGATKQLASVDKKAEAKAMFEFDKQLSKRISLDNAGEDAFKLVRTLRRQEKIEAWVFHDQYKSIVTVGGFESPNDPRIGEIQKKFGAKVVINPNTNQETTVVEIIQLRGSRPNEPHQGQWMFDPFPQVIKIPKVD